MKKPTTYIVIILLNFLLGCTTNSNQKDKLNSTDLSTNSFDSTKNTVSILAGKILNSNVYPHINELKLNVPSFEGDKMVYLTKINESGFFKFNFYPKTKREVQLHPTDDVIIIQPGDSVFVTIDFKDIGNATFSGDHALLNQQIATFRTNYLGRYPTNYQQSYFDFKTSCEKARANSYNRLIEFQQNNSLSDDFNSWAIKQIELDFYKALFHYPFQHHLRSNKALKDTAEYYSFIESFKERVDNSIIMTDYFEVTKQFVGFKIRSLESKLSQQKFPKDSITEFIIADLFSTNENNYFAQFSLRTLLNISLNSNRTDLIDKYIDDINSKIDDPFLRDNLQEHYDRVNEYNKNPKLFSDAILNSDNSFELNTSISTNFDNNNIVKNIIDANQNKVIFVDFWAPWCPPCLHYMEYSKKLMVFFENQDVLFAFVCINSNEEQWKETVEKMNIGGQHLYASTDETRDVRKRFGFSGIPYYLLINKNGVIVDFGNQLNPKNNYVKSQIEKLLNE